MTQSLSSLEAAISQVRDLIEADGANSAKTVFGRTSSFWGRIFDKRSNFPDVNQFVGFRRADFGHGMADERQGGADKEAAHAARAFEIYRQSVDPREVAQLDESPLGAPYVFEHAGIVRSAAFWTNSVTALRVGALARELGLAGRPLRILEIGAGWGLAAHLLHQLLDVEHYAIVDLPENLCLSVPYLSAVLDRPIQAVEMGAGQISTLRPGVIAGALPGAVGNIKAQFDIVLNSFSLQEMDLEAVDAYTDWIDRTLSPDGLFLSFNSHGKAGVRMPSQYLSKSLSLQQMRMFRRYPAGLFNTIPYEMVFTRSAGKAGMESRLMDCLGCLMQFGLDEDLSPLQSAIEKPESDVKGATEDLTGFFSPDPSARRRALTPRVEQLMPGVFHYLDGLDGFALGDNSRAIRAFDAALGNGLAGFAKLRACIQLAILRRRQTLDEFHEDFDAVFAYPELKTMIDSRDGTLFKTRFASIVSVDLPQLQH